MKKLKQATFFALMMFFNLVIAQTGPATEQPSGEHLPTFDESLNLLTFETFDAYKALYKILERRVNQGAIDDQMDAFETQYPGYISFRTDFNQTYDWIDGSFTDEQLRAIYERDYIGDDIDKTVYNQYSEIGIGDFVYVYFAENVKFKINKADINAIMELRQYPRGGALPYQILSNEAVELISNTNEISRGQVTINDSLRYESVTTITTGVCDSYRKSLRVALEQHSKSSSPDCAPYCWSEALYVADEITINWADGSPVETITSVSNQNLSHTYATAGSYSVNVVYTFTDSEGDAQTLTDTITASVGGAVCGPAVEWSVNEERIEGNTKMVSKLWHVDHSGWAYQGVKAYTHSWLKQGDGTWKRKRAEIYVKIDNSTYKNMDCGFLQTVTGDKHRNNRKKVQKTKEINDAGYSRVRASNGDVKSYHYLRKSGLHITDWCIYIPCPDPEPCDIVIEPINYDPKSEVLGDGGGVHTYPTLSGDIDGDGDADLIFVGQNWSSPGLNIRTKISNGDGTYSPITDIQGDGPGVHTYPTLVGDMNGDGKDDLVFVGQGWSGVGLNIRTKFSNGDGTWTQASTIHGDGPGVHTYATLIGDINGDDKDDIIFVGQNWSGAGLNIRTKISNGDGTYNHVSNIQGDGSGVHTYPAMIGDMNGDNRDDIVFIGQNWSGAGLNIRTKFSNGDGSYTHTSDIQGDGSGVHTYPAFIGDVNGDSEDDLVFIGQNWSGAGLNIRTKFSNGDGSYTHASDIQGDGSAIHGYPALSGDFNGDCKMDIMFIGNWDCSRALNIRTKLSAGNGTWFHNAEIHPDGSGVHTNPAIVADVTGNQKSDLVFVGQNWSGAGLNIRTKVSEFSSPGCYDCSNGAVANASFVNPNATVIKPSLYGPKEVTQVCLTDPILVDGSASQCETGYFLEIAEFDLASWSIVGSPFYSSWICSDCLAPNNINITDYVPLSNFDPGKVYKFRLAVGTPWNTKDLFFSVIDCRSSETGVIDTMSNEGLELITIPMYPNPASAKVYVDARMIQGETTLQVYNMFGSTLIEQKIKPGTQNNEINLNSISSGVYLFTITNQNGEIITTSRIIKQ